MNFTYIRHRTNNSKGVFNFFCTHHLIMEKVRKYFSETQSIKTAWVYEDLENEACISFYLEFLPPSLASINTLYKIEERLKELLKRDVFVTTKFAIDHSLDRNWIEQESKVIFSRSL